MVAAELPRCTLVSGPAASGKSLWAESLARQSPLAVCYLATGPMLLDDHDWQRRLDRHRQRRPSSWITKEVGLDLADALGACSTGQLALVDSLGTWVAAGLDLDADGWQRQVEELVQAIEIVKPKVPLIFVGEETGWGVVPSSPEGGVFRDRLGAVLQRVMAHCDAAWLVVHGRAINLLALSQAIPTP